MFAVKTLACVAVSGQQQTFLVVCLDYYQGLDFEECWTAGKSLLRWWSQLKFVSTKLLGFKQKGRELITWFDVVCIWCRSRAAEEMVSWERIWNLRWNKFLFMCKMPLPSTLGTLLLDSPKCLWVSCSHNVGFIGLFQNAQSKIQSKLSCLAWSVIFLNARFMCNWQRFPFSAIFLYLSEDSTCCLLEVLFEPNKKLLYSLSSAVEEHLEIHQVEKVM